VVPTGMTCVSFLSMVPRRARAFFAASLAFALLPLLSLAAGPEEARAHAAMAWMQFQAKSQPAVHGVRTGLSEATTHQHAATPFLLSSPFSFGLTATTHAASASIDDTPRGVASAKLHPARAPPALP
jgi:hypothetical protein